MAMLMASPMDAAAAMAAATAALLSPTAVAGTPWLTDDGDDKAESSVGMDLVDAGEPSLKAARGDGMASGEASGAAVVLLDGEGVEAAAAAGAVAVVDPADESWDSDRATPAAGGARHVVKCLRNASE